ncbi:hypothetical protein Golob_017033 [Gossypium lobatum]|uniref:Plastid lipid-associated protein/fibrillin conserved domain-containing protein n=1 Tax=Gossypium lobatum TaxID=34289 RepID=A0A7J8M6G4_9ROSI|nr:hypothetical protein [Gossypium lobatum]
MGAPLDMAVLDGTWRLQYTSAPDVVVLLEVAARLPFFQVGQIFQKFECRDQLRGGVIRNVVRWSIPNLLEEQEGATLVVSAKFDVVSVRNIYLQFEEIKVQDINISEQLQALIAPALLPRSFLSLQVPNYCPDFWLELALLNFVFCHLHNLHVKLEVLHLVIFINLDFGRSSLIFGWRSVGGLYYLSYLDQNMLLGRAVGGGGVFVFTKAQPLEL